MGRNAKKINKKLEIKYEKMNVGGNSTSATQETCTEPNAAKMGPGSVGNVASFFLGQESYLVLFSLP